MTREQARRLTLTSLGLARHRPPTDRRRDVRHLRQVLRAVRVVQLDSVNVLARAHELPFWSRLGPHDRGARDRWLWRSGELFDGWIHVASLAGVEVWPWLHHRRAAVRPDARLADHLRADPHLLARIRDEVAAQGPVSVTDLADPGRRTGPWWGNPRGKDALDHLVATGELAIRDRDHRFVTVYDLTERVLPAHAHQAPVPPETEARELLLADALAAQGVGTAIHLADHHRQPIGPVRAALARMAERGTAVEVRVEGWKEVAYRHPEAVTVRRPQARTLVSPFDPLVWHRDRTESLFDFRYRIEIYVPAHRREHGYYVLPFLLDDRLVARVDLKADRRADRGAGRLLVRNAVAEPGVDQHRVAAELASELLEMARWRGLREVEVAPRGDLATPLAAAVTAG